jgi:hypothetical protein
MGRELRRELRRKEWEYRRVYEEAFGCRYQPGYWPLPFFRVLAVVAVAIPLVAALAIVGIAIWLAVFGAAVMAIGGAVVHEHLARPQLSFPPPSHGDPSGDREPRKPSPLGGSGVGTA